MLGPSALGHLIESVAWLATSCARGLAILWEIMGFGISKLHYYCVNYIFVLDKRNTAWLRDTVRQTSLGKSAAGPDLWSARRPLTSLGTSAWPYSVTTQYSYCISQEVSIALDFNASSHMEYNEAKIPCYVIFIQCYMKDIDKKDFQSIWWSNCKCFHTFEVKIDWTQWYYLFISVWAY